MKENIYGKKGKEAAMEKCNYACDLHTHTTRSDGADTPPEVIRRAAALGVRVLALTDHDAVPEQRYMDEDGNLVDLLELAETSGVKLLLGTEISCETDVEDVHIVCLGCRWEDAWFAELERELSRSRSEGYQLLLERLLEDGMHITWEEVLDNGGHPVSEEHVLKKMIFEQMARKGYAKDWKQAKLMVRNTPGYQIKRKKPDPAALIREVHRAGGIAILAHPLLIAEQPQTDGTIMTRKAYIDRLVEAGLDGIEACYTYDKTSYEGTLTKCEAESYIRENYADRVAIMSGGSDYHADQKKGAVHPRELGECGVTEEYFYGNPLLAALLQ